MKSTHYFGTDGVRGRVGQLPINSEFVLKLGWAVGKVVSANFGKKVLIGKDTRISGYMLESALQSGLSAAGVDVYLVGPLPTPAIAYLTRTLQAHVGIVISASHNPYYDNGIKLFSTEGFKIPDEKEIAIEHLLDQPMTTVEPHNLGKSYRLHDGPGRYIEFCKSAVPHSANFKHLKIVIDCANGATYQVAPKIFAELGAKVIAINVSPNGLNINDNCGSTHPEILQKTVMSEKADLGIAFDGDGDRVMMVDHKGEIVDGDELLFIIAKNRLTREGFFGGVIGTQMSNMGLENALANLKIPFKRTNVGDRYVMLALEKEKWILGGESSGHIVCLDVTTTGDGIISALRVIQSLTEEGKSLHELKAAMHKLPQVMINVNCDKVQLDILNQPQVKKVIQSAEEQLKGKGRILVRKSGTEALFRIMVEGEDLSLVEQLAKEIAERLTISHIQ